MSTYTSIKRIETRKGRLAAWFGAVAVASVFGTFAWMMAILFFVLGALAVHTLGLDVPSWTGWLALVGFPLGAYLEVHYTL